MLFHVVVRVFVTAPICKIPDLPVCHFWQHLICSQLMLPSRLRQAGAVLVAKLATGEMAYDDVWFDGFTKNPWNIAEGSSGSSAGPAAAVAAGLVPFALGTETGGSITYPANTCGVTAHRPSFGLVGRSNIMSLAESLVSMCLRVCHVFCIAHQNLHVPYAMLLTSTIMLP